MQRLAVFRGDRRRFGRRWLPPTEAKRYPGRERRKAAFRSCTLHMRPTHSLLGRVRCTVRFRAGSESEDPSSSSARVTTAAERVRLGCRSSHLPTGGRLQPPPTRPARARTLISPSHWQISRDTARPSPTSGAASSPCSRACGWRVRCLMPTAASSIGVRAREAVCPRVSPSRRVCRVC